MLFSLSGMAIDLRRLWLTPWVSGFLALTIPLIDWLMMRAIGSAFVRLIDWLIDWWGVRLILLPIDCASDWLIDWLMDDASDWFCFWLIDWLMDCLVDWLLGWLIDWLIETDSSFKGNLEEFVRLCNCASFWASWPLSICPAWSVSIKSSFL